MISRILLSYIERIFLFYYDSILVTGMLIVLVLMARVLLRNRSKRLFCVVWTILLIRLLLPFSVRTRFGVIPNITQLFGMESNAGYSMRGENENGDVDSGVGDSDDGRVLNHLTERAENGDVIGFGEADDIAAGSSGMRETEYTNGDGIRETEYHNMIETEEDAYIDRIRENEDAGNNYEAEAGESNRSSFGWEKRIPTLLTVIWLIGVVGLTVYYAVRSRMLYAKTRYAVRYAVKTEKVLTESDCFFMDTMKSSTKASSNTMQPEIYQWPDTTGACVIGLFRPRIYLPAGINKVEEEILLRHEGSHISRRDYILIAGYLTALILNWMNPLVWLCYYLCKEDIEMACDETALSGVDISFRQAYAKLLLAYTTSKKTPALLSFGYGNLKLRFERIGRRYTMKKWQKVVTILISTSVIVLGSAACGSLAEQAERPEQEAVHNRDVQTVHYLGENDQENRTTDGDRNNTNNDYEIIPIDPVVAGADLPVIDYVDDEEVIFHDASGLYVYNYDAVGMVGYMNGEQYGLNQTQGDDAVFYSVNETGERVYITNASGTLAYTYYVKEQKVETGLAMHEALWQGAPVNDPDTLDGFHVPSEYTRISDVYPAPVSKEMSLSHSIDSSEDAYAFGDQSLYYLAFSYDEDGNVILNIVQTQGPESLIAAMYTYQAGAEILEWKKDYNMDSDEFLHMLDSSFDTDIRLIDQTEVDNEYFRLTIPDELVGKISYAMVIRGDQYGVTFFADDMRDRGGILCGIAWVDIKYLVNPYYLMDEQGYHNVAVESEKPAQGYYYDVADIEGETPMQGYYIVYGKNGELEQRDYIANAEEEEPEQRYDAIVNLGLLREAGTYQFDPVYEVYRKKYATGLEGDAIAYNADRSGAYCLTEPRDAAWNIENTEESDQYGRYQQLLESAVMNSFETKSVPYDCLTEEEENAYQMLLEMSKELPQ